MITFRKATLNDLQQLTELRINFLKEVHPEPDDSRDKLLSDQLQSYFKEHLQTGDFVNWLAEDDDKIIATGGISFYSIPPNFFNLSGNRAYILNIYTLPEYRRKGIAKQVFEKLMNEAKARGVTQVSLHASEDGRPLYQQFGFMREDKEMVWNS
jgi:ribosomal protein S18 acetylase RimI-like enzyme